MRKHKYLSVKRYFNRFIFHINLKSIKIIAYFNHGLSTKLYCSLLRKHGMEIIGTPRYIGVHVEFDDPKLIKLSERVVISDYCYFLTHDYSITTALIAIGETPKKDISLERYISVGENVFIGKKSIVMPNTKIGNNVIVGAGSVVRGVLEDNSIYIGNPAKKIRNITEQAEIWKKYLDTSYVVMDK